VTMGAGGIPSYDIVRPSAWDAIQTTEALVAAAAAAPAVIFGSLAQARLLSRSPPGLLQASKQARHTRGVSPLVGSRICGIE
jgi:hypothetical protein